MPSLATAPPKHVAPFVFHGVVLGDLSKDQIVGDCPFCGGEGKLSVEAATGLWNCFVCGEKGNTITFLRKLWDESAKKTNGQSNELATERGLLFPETLTAWGAAVSTITGEWLLPGFGPDGKLCQLYRWVKGRERKLLLPTPGLHHGLFQAGVDPLKPELWVCEGPWDGMVLWEALRSAKKLDEGLVVTASEGASLLAEVNVVAAPGATTWHDDWAKLAKGKRVVLLYDNDHDRTHPKTGKLVESPGWAGMRRAAQALHAHRDRPNDIAILRWNPKGRYNEKLQDGCDIRDILRNGTPTATDRIANLPGILSKITPIPEDWIPGRAKASAKGSGIEIEPQPCSSWSKVVNAWRLALHWRPDLETALAAMLAVAASTSQQDDQLFLQVIGDAGSAKTRLCDAMLVSRNCFQLGQITSFHSGWRDGSGEDYSLLSRINHKTLITPEGDVLMSSPHFPTIMSQMRRIYDGSSRAIYANQKEDKEHSGLRIPWILVGTPALLDVDQSRLGDRFLKVVIGQASHDEIEDICMRAGFAADEAVKFTSNGDASSCLSEKLLTAYRITGGYVDHLRRNASELLSSLGSAEEPIVRRCYKLATLCAQMRARPNLEAKDHKERHDTVELPSRLTKQLVRMANCLAVSVQQPRESAKVMGIVKKVALDTCRGRTFEIARALASPKVVAAGGCSLGGLSLLTGQTENAERSLLLFLARIKVAESWTEKAGLSNRHRWRLTPKFSQLWKEVMNAETA